MVDNQVATEELQVVMVDSQEVILDIRKAMVERIAESQLATEAEIHSATLHLTQTSKNMEAQQNTLETNRFTIIRKYKSLSCYSSHLMAAMVARTPMDTTRTAMVPRISSCHTKPRAP